MPTIQQQGKSQSKNGQRAWIDISQPKNIQMANKYMKRYSTSLISREMQSKPQWNTNLHLLAWLMPKISVGVDVRNCDLCALLVECKVV